MGIYINPGNENFREIRREEYVDKSGLISEMNKTLGTRGDLGKEHTCRIEKIKREEELPF